MTEHLPECWAKDPSDPPAWCICDELRACERRVRTVYAISHVRDEQAADGIAFGNGYAAGLDAAEAAVAEIENDPDAQVDYDRDYTADPSGSTRNPRIWLRSAIDAIRALKEKP